MQNTTNAGSTKKIGFISALSICFTSVVGIGIFLKNASVGKNVEGNGVSWLLTWIIAGLLAIGLAYHFGKISIVESKKGLTGLSSWANEISDEKNNWFKRNVSINYGFFYNPILTLCVSFFCTEFFVLFLQTANENIKINVWGYVVITFLFLAFFILNNYFSLRFSGYISLTTSILKFIPLLLVIIVGLAFANKHNFIPTSADDSVSQNGFNKPLTIDKALQGIMLSIPSVLFAFDSFVGVGSWSTHIKGGTKATSRVIVVSMILVTVVYCLICLTSIFHFIPNEYEGGTTILNVLKDSLPRSLAKGMSIFLTLFIFISAFGTSNSICGTMFNEFRNIINHGDVIFVNSLRKRLSLKSTVLIILIITLLVWSLIIFVPTIVMENDSIIDGFSNVAVVTIFLIYSYLIFLFWKNIYIKTNEKSWKTIWYSISIWVVIIGVLAVSLLNLYYVFYDAIKKPNVSSNWGLFLDEGKNFRNIDVLIFYLVFIFVYFAFPYINDFFIKKSKSKI